MRTHYDVLNLDKTCSSKEIKESFIKLSKQYHPDKNKSSDAHKKFVEVNEAYSVLGKPDTRCKYDNTLSNETQRMYYRPGPSSTMRTPYEEYAYMYVNNMRRQQDPSGAYITTKKISAFVFCCVLMMIGSGIQLKAELMRRDRRTQEIAKYLKESKERNKKSREQRKKEYEAAMLKKTLEKQSLQKEI